MLKNMDLDAGGHDRGLSNMVGVMILLATVLVIIGGVAAFSGGTFDSAKTGVDVGLVERDLTKLSGVIHDVSFGSNSVQTVGLNLRTVDDGGSTLVKQNAGSMEVTVSRSGGDTVVYDGPLGAVEYENKQTHVAYQGGGVWRKGENGASVVDPAGFALEDYSTETLSLPIMVVRGDGTISSGATVQMAADPSFSKYKLDSGETVTVQVESTYYTAWARYLTDRLDVPEDDVSINDDSNTVSATIGGSDASYLHVSIYRVTVDEN